MTSFVLVVIVHVVALARSGLQNSTALSAAHGNQYHWDDGWH